MKVFVFVIVISFVWIIAKASWLAFMRRNNPTYPDHRSLDDYALAYEHEHGRLLNIPLRRSPNVQPISGGKKDAYS